MRYLLPCLVLLLAGCSSGLSIQRDYSSANHASRVQYVVLHYTSTDLEHSLQLLTEGPVSSHYLIGEESPTLYQLVDENRRAWHAGDSSWQGRTWLNGSSIGIELVNPGYRETPAGRVWAPYSEAQIEVLLALLQDIVRRHGLAPDSIIGHSDIAPQRKVDPGPLFPWARLAAAGLIRWPDAQAVARVQGDFSERLPEPLWFQQQLAALGYAIALSGEHDEQTRNVLAAFQMKYRPARHDGLADAQTAALLQVLNSH